MYQVYNPPSKPNLVTWLGGAIFGATDVVVTRSLTREQYLKDPSVPDWSDLRYCKLWEWEKSNNWTYVVLSRGVIFHSGSMSIYRSLTFPLKSLFIALLSHLKPCPLFQVQQQYRSRRPKTRMNIFDCAFIFNKNHICTFRLVIKSASYTYILYILNVRRGDCSKCRIIKVWWAIRNIQGRKNLIKLHRMSC